jgi:integrase/recombinase XerD
MVRNAALKAGLIMPTHRCKVTLHKLRYTFAMKMMDQVGIFRLKELLGHESIATTERYLHADIEDLRRAYERGSRALALDLQRVTGSGH